ncbi:hypothetical protein [Clostridium sp.]
MNAMMVEFKAFIGAKFITKYEKNVGEKVIHPAGHLEVDRGKISLLGV